jgi:hypothetical protein
VHTVSDDRGSFTQVGVCRVDNIESCIADCMANDACGCAFYRPSDRQPVGYCALTNAECSDPTIGAQVDYTRIRTAIVKCGYNAPAAVEEAWPDETYDGTCMCRSHSCIAEVGQDPE